jgi:hypothetical protein
LNTEKRRVNPGVFYWILALNSSNGEERLDTLSFVWNFSQSFSILLLNKQE